MPIRKAGRWVVTVSLDHEALEVYQGFTKGQKSAKVCSALILYNVHTKKNRNDAAKEKLRDRKMYRLEKELKVANYRIECIQSGATLILATAQLYISRSWQPKRLVRFEGGGSDDLHA